MTDLTFRLENFEGPLDVLLRLISKHKQNICDIEISSLVDQYLDFMESLAECDYEFQSEFLEMAARLIYIKVLSLLPENGEAEEMKKELEGRLIDYDKAKSAAAALKKRFCGFEVFVREPVFIPIDSAYRLTHEKDLLSAAYSGLSGKAEKKKAVTAESFDKIVRTKIYPVQVKIVALLRKLYLDGEARLTDIFDGASRSERVASFLAVLELTKAGRITLDDSGTSVSFNRQGKLPKHFTGGGTAIGN